jgi:serine/threonine-protein kinase
MHATLFQSEDLRERFRREATVAAHVDSEFIVDVFDAGVDEATGMPFLVMEMLRGEELGQRLKRLGRLEADEALNYLHYVALALDKTHQASIIHRDLKPANVFLAEREEGGVRVKVLDFGIAKIVAEGATTGSTTQSLGTPLYMAPEQFNPRSKLTNAVDIYAFGMMAYTLLVGVPYWFEEARGGNVYAVVALAIHGIAEPATIRAAAQGVQLPPTFDTWFAKATALDPKQRFATASAAAQDLAIAFGKAPQGRPSMASMSTEMPYSMPAPSASAAANIAATPPHMLAASAVGTTRMGQTPESTAMSAAATLPKPARSMSTWLFAAGGCIAVLSLGLGGFFLIRGDSTTTSADTISASNPTPISSNASAPVISAMPLSPAMDDKPTANPTKTPSAVAPSTKTAPTPTTARTSTPVVVARTATPVATPATTSTSTKKKSYTRE